MIADMDAAGMQDLAAETAVHQLVHYVVIPIAHAAQAIASKFQAITIIRGTVDLDIVISINLDNLKRAEKTLKELNLTSRIPVTAEDIFKFR
ncbi:MAG: hypothetical protein V4596_14305 [Bdellovibrionota bacterium]